MEELYESGEIDYKLDRPVIKDSVIVHDGGYTVVRFRSSNPGWWSFHCHLEFHLEAGNIDVNINSVPISLNFNLTDIRFHPIGTS